MYLTQNRQMECFNFTLFLTVILLSCLDSFLYYCLCAEYFLFLYILSWKISLLKILKCNKFSPSQ